MAESVSYVDVIRAPDLRVSHLVREEGAAPFRFTLLAKRGAEDTPIVLTTKPEGGPAVLGFSGIGEFLAWWIRRTCPDVDRATTPALRGPMSVVTALYCLQAIDLYRRASALTSDRGEPSLVLAPFDEFAAEVATSVDVFNSWSLASAFAHLTPARDCLGPPAPSDVRALLGSGLVGVERDPLGDHALALTEQGRALGSIFASSWRTAIGISAFVRTGSGWAELFEGFVAPTTAGHHVLTLEPARDSTPNVLHQVLSTRELFTKLFAVIDGGLNPAAVAFAEDRVRRWSATAA